MILILSDPEDKQPRCDSYEEFLEYAAKQKPGIDRTPFTEETLADLIHTHASEICVQVKYILINYNFFTEYM